MAQLLVVQRSHRGADADVHSWAEKADGGAQPHLPVMVQQESSTVFDAHPVPGCDSRRRMPIAVCALRVLHEMMMDERLRARQVEPSSMFARRDVLLCVAAAFLPCARGQEGLKRLGTVR